MHIMRLYHQDWSRRQLEARTGRLEQVGGLRRWQGVDGPEAGVEMIQVRTGAGLAFTVVPSRGLDISVAEFGGVPLSWQSAAGETHPAFFDPSGAEWLRTAAGGLLMTCGLTQVGAPNLDEGESLGIHGRVHHLPARQVAAEGRWVGDEYEMRVAGVIDEAIMFGHHLRLTREIRSWLGQNRLEIHDQVENLGFAPAPHMILYHFNFGFPLLNEETVLDFPSQAVVARDEGTPVEGYDRWQPPQAGYQERVYYHKELVAREDGTVTAAVQNPYFPLPGGHCDLTVRLSWPPEQLPRLVQWKMSGAGLHVLGIEPANCLVEGRAAERQRGRLVFLEPGESRTYDLALEVEIQ
jgi:hypothetical protein